MPQEDGPLPPLTARQKRFVEEYLRDLVATRAAIRAGYSARNAGKIGPRLTHKPQIAAAIREALEAKSKRDQEQREMESRMAIERHLARFRR
jgi:phage terminase small subunit